MTITITNSIIAIEKQTSNNGYGRIPIRKIRGGVFLGFPLSLVSFFYILGLNYSNALFRVGGGGGPEAPRNAHGSYNNDTSEMIL